KSRSERASEPLVIPRPVMPAAEARNTPVLGYEPPTARRQQPQPRTPTAKKPSKWPLVLVAIFGFRMLVYGLSQDHLGSPATSPPPPRSYAPQPPSYIDTPPYKRNPPLTTATPSRPNL